MRKGHLAALGLLIAVSVLCLAGAVFAQGLAAFAHEKGGVEDIRRHGPYPGDERGGQTG